jgi:tyrosyl-tRNA synthetase
MLHGEKEGKNAFETSISVFVKKEIGNQTNLPIIKIKRNEIKDGLSILDLVVRSKLLKSKGEVRRAIKDKGIKIDDEPIDNDNFLLSLEIFKELDLIKLSHGKKNHVIIKLSN